jgi:hypothetical protein
MQHTSLSDRLITPSILRCCEDDCCIFIRLGFFEVVLMPVIRSFDFPRDPNLVFLFQVKLQQKMLSPI